MEAQTAKTAGPAPTPLQQRIANDFEYHAPTEGDVEIMRTIRSELGQIAQYIAAHVPGGREQSTALTKLEEAMMWANAGIARQRPVTGLTGPATN